MILAVPQMKAVMLDLTTAATLAHKRISNLLPSPPSSGMADKHTVAVLDARRSDRVGAPKGTPPTDGMCRNTRVSRFGH